MLLDAMVARSKGENLLTENLLLNMHTCTQGLVSNTKIFYEVAVKRSLGHVWHRQLLWFCNYKYHTENTVSYVALNKIGMFLLWMDLCWKNAFGKMLVIGSVAPFRVKGLRSLP
ncbi:elongation factor 1-gamma 3-like isoform X2 [Lolium rigidum]|nr:elongation factor 1-gamma 3-like isoform X2 [Lolium rigidum]